MARRSGQAERGPGGEKDRHTCKDSHYICIQNCADVDITRHDGQARSGSVKIEQPGNRADRQPGSCSAGHPSRPRSGCAQGGQLTTVDGNGGCQREHRHFISTYAKWKLKNVKRK